MGEPEKGVRRVKWSKNAFRQARGLLRVEVLATSVFINNAAHIRATSWPYTFFSNLRHSRSSPWVSSHFQRQQGSWTCVSWPTSKLTLPTVQWHYSLL